MKKNKMVYVRWVDSCMQASWVNAPSEETGTIEIETIGYLIYSDKKHIEVAQSIAPVHKSGIMSIPQSVILERKNLKVRK